MVDLKNSQELKEKIKRLNLLKSRANTRDAARIVDRIHTYEEFLKECE